MDCTQCNRRVVNTGEHETHVPQRLQIGDILFLTLNNFKNYCLALPLILRERSPCAFGYEPMPLFVALAQLVLLKLANGLLILTAT